MNTQADENCLQTKLVLRHAMDISSDTITILSEKGRRMLYQFTKTNQMTSKLCNCEN